MNPLITIIIPTFNSQATLRDCLASIAAQTYPNKEVVIVDGGSTDETPTIVQAFENVLRNLVWRSEADRGVYDAMNKGIDLATGDFLFFLGSDDQFYTPTVLEEMFSNRANEAYDLVYGNVFFKHARAVYSGESSREKLIGDQVSICHQAIFYRRRIFDLVGKYDLKYFVHADYDLNVKCFEHPDIKTKYLDVIVALYNETGISGQQSNRDGFHDQLTLHYISTYASPFDLVKKIKKLERELQAIRSSPSYRLLHRCGKLVLKLRTFLKR